MQEQKRLELLALYNANRNRIETVMKACGPKMYSPFYASSVDKYWTAPKRIVFVGQQPGGEWNMGIDPVKPMEWYKAFTDNTSVDGDNSDNCHGPFWSAIGRIEKELGNPRHSSPWLNINRCAERTDKSKAPTWPNLIRLAELDFLLLEELKILAPDCVIFFTGPTRNYDQRISTLLKGKVILCEGFKRQQLYRYESPELKATIFRTYHPTYLRRSKLKLEGPVLNYITAQIKN